MQGPVFLQSFWEICKICEILTNYLLFSGLNCPCAVKQRQFYTNFESFRTSFKVISQFEPSLICWWFQIPYPTLVISAKCQILHLFAAKNWPSFYFDFANDKIFLTNLPVATTKRPSRGGNRVLMTVKSMTSGRISLRNKKSLHFLSRLYEPAIVLNSVDEMPSC